MGVNISIIMILEEKRRIAKVWQIVGFILLTHVWTVPLAKKVALVRINTDMQTYNYIQYLYVIFIIIYLCYIKDDCLVSGQCVGSFVTDVQAEDIDDCLRKCQTYDGPDIDGDGEPDQVCNWFTYDTLTQGCELLSTCESITDSCSSCSSGNTNCGPRPPLLDYGIHVFS